MNYRQAEHLLAVYEEGSISRAASRLGVSQPAVYKRLLKVLEQLKDFF